MANANSVSEATTLTLSGSPLSTPLFKLLMADSIEPGSDPSYQLCKIIYLYHPLGAKMTEGPIRAAQSQPRIFKVPNAPEEVVKAIEDEHRKLKTDENVRNVATLRRVYGVSSIALGCVDKPTEEPLDYEALWKETGLYFSVFDPLNTAGSLVLNQNPSSPNFEKPTFLRVNNQVFHRSRYEVLMNEQPVYIAYTSSSFGYVGRSVYQRALFPLKSFVRSMIADDMIQKKLGLIIAKQKAPGSILNKAMAGIIALKRSILKQAETDNVVSIGVEEDVETLDMQNVEGAGTYSRTNIIKNAATAGDMPAVILENETLTEGFGEGTEDAKNIARYITSMRAELDPVYRWFDNIAQYRAWNPEFFAMIQRMYPEYAERDFKEVFFDWKAAYTATWPSWLIEPESEAVKVEETKLQAIVSVLEKLMPEMDPENKMRVIQWAADNISENKRVFAYELLLDYDALKDHQEEQKQNEKDNVDAQNEALRNGTAFGEAGGGDEGGGNEGKGAGKVTQLPKAGVKKQKLNA